jgi:hypothetical protein
MAWSANGWGSMAWSMQARRVDGMVGAGLGVDAMVDAGLGSMAWSAQVGG